MKVETLDLHGLNVKEAKEKTRKNIDWLLKHGIDVLVINHGKGLHSSHNFGVLKSEIRKYLKEELLYKNSDYLIIYGESDAPVALAYNEGNTLVVARGVEKQYLGGKVQQEKNQRIFSDEGKQARKHAKNIRKQRKNRY